MDEEELKQAAMESGLPEDEAQAAVDDFLLEGLEEFDDEE